MNLKSLAFYLSMSFASLAIFSVIHTFRLSIGDTSDVKHLRDPRVPVFLLRLNQYSRDLLGSRFISIVPLGSAAKGMWRTGSDIDLVIAAKQIKPFEKTAIYRHYFIFGKELNMLLEAAPCPHPPIWFASTSFKWALASMLLSGRADSPIIRKGLKLIAPKAGDIKEFLPLIS